MRKRPCLERAMRVDAHQHYWCVGRGDDAWIARAPIDAGLESVTRLGLRFDALVRSRHLPHLLERMQRHPELPIVIDHAAKPDVRSGEFDAWRERIAPLALLPRVYCKLSGLLTEAPP